MRESRKTEGMHLPRGAMESWLESQTPKPNEEARHRPPPEDPYEAWIERRVGEALARRKAAA